MMPIRKIAIEKFRGLVAQEFNPNGKRLNAIIGQNGSMKTTLLGIIAASFSIRSNPMGGIQTIDNKDFNTVLTSRFNFSETFDPPREHKWTVYVDKNINSEPIPFSSYARPGGKLRFWIEGDRKKGTTLIQCPVIYLSLGRLSPLGEQNKLMLSPDSLTKDELDFFKTWHNMILSSLDSINSAEVITSSGKNGTVGANTDYYEASTISAGQDNVGSIILSVLSMKRLKEQYRDAYVGSIICIDELESTLYPASQIHMIEFLKNASDKYQIQFFFTTHSMTIIRALFTQQMERFVSITYAKKIGRIVELRTGCSLDQIEQDLYIKRNRKQSNDRVKVYCEDRVGMEFTKVLISGKYTQKEHVAYQNNDGMNLGYTNYKTLLDHKTPEFIHSIIVLDGDVKEKKEYNELKKYKNVVFLPTKDYPELFVYKCLKNLPETDLFWSKELGGFSKQACFDGFMDNELDEGIIKKWFETQKTENHQKIGKLFRKALDNENEEARVFLEAFNAAYEYVKLLAI